LKPREIERCLVYVSELVSSLSHGCSCRHRRCRSFAAEKLIYPDISESLLRGGEILLTIVYLLVYAYWAGRVGFYKRFKYRS